MRRRIVDPNEDHRALAGSSAENVCAPVNRVQRYIADGVGDSGDAVGKLHDVAFGDLERWIMDPLCNLNLAAPSSSTMVVRSRSIDPSAPRSMVNVTWLSGIQPIPNDAVCGAEISALEERSDRGPGQPKPFSSG